MENKSNLENKTKLAPAIFPAQELVACHTVCYMSTVCLLWRRPLWDGGMDATLLPSSDDISLSCCPISLLGYLDLLGKQLDGRKIKSARVRGISVPQKGMACQPLETKIRRACRERREGHADHRELKEMAWR